MTQQSIDQYLNASGQNKLTDNASLDYFSDNIQPKGYLGASKGKNIEKLNEILKWYNLKRASCLQAQSPDNPNMYLIRILVPISNDANTKAALQKTNLGKVYLKLGYRDITVKIPKEKLNSLDKTFNDPNSISCQNLYLVYCKNMIESYKNVNGRIDDGFVDFRPECACFVPIPDEIKKTGVNISPLCIMPGCDNVQGVFLDPVSRGNKNCDLNICQSTINFSNLSAGGNINLSNKIVQTCGAEEKNIDKQETVGTDSTQFTIPYLKQIGNSQIGKYFNNAFGKNTTNYLVITASFSLICCVMIFIIIIFYFAF